MVYLKLQASVLLVGVFIWYSVESSTADQVSYPITASWFRDRYSIKEWDDTLDQFASISGDTVLLRAPPVLIRSKEDILRDPNFQWCWDEAPTRQTQVDCVTGAEQALSKHRLDIAAFATFQYEEDFSEYVIQCPELEEKLNSSRVYYRLVLPLDQSLSKTCDLPPGTKVMVVLTSFSGIDPHWLLVESAAKRNMSVYFGLPSVPMATAGSGILRDYTAAYYAFVGRVLLDHSCRYGGPCSEAIYLKFRTDNVKKVFKMTQAASNKTMYDTIAGYYSTDEVCIALLARQDYDDEANDYKELYTNLGKLVHLLPGKRFVLSPQINTNIFLGNYSVDQHRDGFEILARLEVADVIAVHEGRGCAKGCYYWETQKDLPIASVDPVLDEINRHQLPDLKKNVTYSELYRGSNDQLFPKLAETRDKLKGEGNHFELWLNVEAFEYLRSDPCLPVDPMGSGMAEIWDRASKSRVDWALTVAGSLVQKVISFAWDPDFTCTTRREGRSLLEEIKAEAGKPIISNCSWHSPQNMSIVIIGYNLLGLTEKFNVDYPTYKGRQHDSLSGYYWETDWGRANDREPSLLYTQLYDLWGIQYLRPHGVVRVTADGAHHPCVFTY